MARKPVDITCPRSFLEESRASFPRRGPRNFEALFVRIVEQLSGELDTRKIVNEILRDICTTFGVGCGFVYEVKGSSVLELMEYYETYRGHPVHPRFALEDIFSAEEIDELSRRPMFFSRFWQGTERPHTPFSRFFKANTVLLMPVHGTDGNLIAVVGMVDRRIEVFENDSDVHTARVLLNLLINYVKIRISNRNLEASRTFLTGIMDNIGFDIYVTDYHTDEVLYATPHLADPVGGLTRVLGSTCWEVFHRGSEGRCAHCPKPRMPVPQGGDDPSPEPLLSDIQRPEDGAWFRKICAVFRWVDGRFVHVVSSVDITENKRNEEIIYRMAYLDEGTGLPNRARLNTDLARCLEEARDGGHGVYVFFFDLDGFKAVNDTLGHFAGDELLRLMADTLQSDPDFRGRLYRHGGDEFVLIYTETDSVRVRAIARKVLEYFQKPWVLRDGQAVCRASIGVAHHPTDGNTPEELIARADASMYTAKRSGKNRAVFPDGTVEMAPESAGGLT
ncbi:GGDEF domain-containing protein [Phaeovibrio sulfidiphilus]|uniref:GGDEF domain-containing protein n=1 Tax=Phaeovibrio sulfidiphilus TaxID=1220600 RepID=A0A8J6YLR5_9PROT|nr:GGDEF domain-containing protein [Phaeovibrio sulfidiphilus]MBE1236725.1 GGDEF domain-containing protein [Phaeovibrio sulfidiphilus]